MRIKHSILVVLFSAILLVSCAEKVQQRNFITRDGNVLKDGDSTFRFLSFNIPNINFVEDEMEFSKPHPFRLPTSFEIRDAFESVKAMGGTVVRAYTFPVKRASDTLGIPRYVVGPGEFDENSFRVMDTVLALANETDIRLILPLLNNWKWMGGVPQYAGFRDKKEEEFWTDSLLISDFKKTIEYVLNRKNTVTGIAYKDDKSILCWETGNELWSPYSWVEDIVTYIKSIDTNHLVMDGYNAIDGIDIHERSITDTLVDIVSTHHYKLNPREIIIDIEKQLNRINGRKPYIVGEFGFLGTTAIEQISEFIIQKDIVGGLIWSLRYHREEGGFYWHSEPLGGDIFKSFHYPGFASGVEYNEEKFLKMYRKKAYQIRNIDIPKIEIPKSPQLLTITTTSEISWQGSAGAECYDVQRAVFNDDKWETIGYNISDADKYYRPLFNDNTSEIGKSYKYRVIAKNIAGNSSPSNVVGPVICKSRTLIDELENLTVLYYIDGEHELKFSNDRIFKEDPHRLEVSNGTVLYYFTPGRIISAKVYSFSVQDSTSIKFNLSNDGLNYQKIDSKRKSYFLGRGDYNYWVPTEYLITVSDTLKENNYLKMDIEELNQISRIEINYLPAGHQKVLIVKL